ncbi:unnamed protein product [Allacma fusca]|uniref:Uncharacterized protein n=1 Tax=Allacma fusca TaxID=39272 RepID=A0A8J2KCF1_9HEXA|nr:unnamed protein product [Allacma fusca]
MEKYKINEPVELTCLKRLKFEDLCSSCAHIQFLEGILNRCTPECLDLWLYNTDALAYLLTQDKAENLKKLKLTVSGISRESWKHLGNLRFLRLSSLFFCSNDSAHEPDDLQHWHLFCQNVSPLLEEFVTNLSNLFPPNLIFPNLKSIRIVNFIAWSYFTPDRFPSLVEITFDFDGPLTIKAQNEVPHRGVSSLSILIKGDREESYSLREGLMNLLAYLKRQFPEVSSLTFSIRRFWRTILPDIFESFSKLITLTLDGNCDFSCMSGMKESVVNENLEKGLPIERIPRRKSITDFVELETIKFGREFVMDPLMLRYCLPRVPKLRQIYLYWNGSLSTPLLWDSFSHLESIFIFFHADDKQVAMTQVAETFPNAFIE